LGEGAELELCAVVPGAIGGDGDEYRVEHHAERLLERLTALREQEVTT
jgi:hypothetical protein